TLFSHLHEISLGKNDNFHPIYLLHLPCRLRAVLDFGLMCNLIQTTLALYVVSVRQARTMPPVSFRFHLAMDTLTLRSHFPLLGRVRDLHPIVITHTHTRYSSLDYRRDEYLVISNRYFCTINLLFEMSMVITFPIQLIPIIPS